MRILIYILFFVVANCHIKAQNIFDKKHSFAYAKHLTCEGNYTLAQETLEPFIGSDQIDSVYSLYLHCIYQSNEKHLLFQTIKTVLQKPQISSPFLNQFAAICIDVDSIHYLKPIWQSLHPELQIRYLLLQENDSLINDFFSMNQQPIDSGYYMQLHQRIKQNKKPVKKLPILLSVFIPGSGKMAIGNTYEGMLHLFLESTHTYLSIYSFNRHGALSVFAYTNLLMGSIFYGGNIWGTYRSLVRKKTFEIQQIKNEIKANLYTSFYPIVCN